MHESGEGCTFLSALAFTAKFFFYVGAERPRATKGGKHSRKESAMARRWGVGCTLSIFACLLLY